MALNIFEPRYRLMVRRCMEGNRCFGMASVSQGHALSEVACLAEIMTCQPLPDGCVCAMPARVSSLALISVLCVPRMRALVGHLYMRSAAACPHASSVAHNAGAGSVRRLVPVSGGCWPVVCPACEATSCAGVSTWRWWASSASRSRGHGSR